MVESKVTSKYQITIPKEIRKRYELEEGDHLIVTPFGDKIILEKKKKARLAEKLPLKIKAVKVEDVHQWRELAKKKAGKRSG